MPRIQFKSTHPAYAFVWDASLSLRGPCSFDDLVRVSAQDLLHVVALGLGIACKIAPEGCNRRRLAGYDVVYLGVPLPYADCSQGGDQALGSVYGLNVRADTGCPGRVSGGGCAPGSTFTIGG
jgi:hypothetical protein